MPLEVEVSSTAGLFLPQGFVDFGVGGSFDAPKTVDLYLHNPLKKVLNINSITSTSPAVKIDVKNFEMPPSTKLKDCLSTVHVASLTLDCK